MFHKYAWTSEVKAFLSRFTYIYETKILRHFLGVLRWHKKCWLNKIIRD